MDIIISNSSGKPIYEQVEDQIKAAILSGELSEGEQLPSIRGLANSLRVSAITTKRAYTDLEAAGFIETMRGKGASWRAATLTSSAKSSSGTSKSSWAAR